MQWKDLFYFSQGERRGLTLLLLLIVVAWILLYYPEVIKSDMNGMNTGTTGGTSLVVDTVRGKSNPDEKQQSGKPVFATRSYQKYEKQEKYSPGTIVELNSADTLILKKIPGIGSAFAKRIVKFRELTGGFYSVDQLAEVYGIDEERFKNLRPWFYTDTCLIRKIDINQLTEEELRKHPYISPRQAKVMVELRKRKGKIRKDDLRLLEEFTEYDWKRLKGYLE